MMAEGPRNGGCAVAWCGGSDATSSLETAFRIAGIEGRSSIFDFIGVTAENRCRLFRKMPRLDWN
jgi:hypothetical protein